jgi:polar amino acid transport system substrate-binding protein
MTVKKDRVNSIIIIFTQFIFFHSICFAEVWKGACERDFPPFNFMKSGNHIGMDTEIVALIMKKLNIKFTIETDTWDGVFHLLKKEEVDFAWQFVDTPDRRKLFHLVGPFRYGFDTFMVRSDSKITNWHHVNDFKGMTIGVIRTYSYIQEFDQFKNFKRKEFINISQLVQGLVNKDVDFIIGDFYSLTYISKKYKLTNKIRFLPSSIKKIPRYVAFSQKNKSKSIIFESVLKEVMATQEYKDITDKYIKNE